MASQDEIRRLQDEIETKRQARERLRAARRRRLLIYGVTALLVACIAGFVAYRLNRPWIAVSLEEMVPPGGTVRVNLLVLGIDSRESSGGRSDTMLVVSVDPNTHDVGVLSVPRDTRVSIPGRSGFDKVNAAHAYGGPQLAVRTVENLLDAPIHYYVTLDFDAFRDFIDALGGVELEIDAPMQYVDRAQNLFINLQPGVQRLNGEQALQYVRFRADQMGDISEVGQGEYRGRVERQLAFIQAVGKELLRPNVLARAPSLAGQLIAAVETNLTPEAVVHLATIAQHIDGAGVQTGIVPGNGQVIDSVSYWVTDAVKVRETVDRLIWGVQDVSINVERSGSR